MRIGMVALVVSWGLLLMPSRARACTYDGGAESIVPDGATHPANAAVVLTGWLLDPEWLVATIDGEPAEITVDEDLSILHSSENVADMFHVLSLRLEPTPEPGQHVAITGSPCHTGCPEIAIAYVASEPDLEILGAAPTMSFDIARFSEPISDSCGNSGSRVRVAANVDALAYAGEALVMFEATARNDDAGLVATARHVLSEADFRLDVEFGQTGADFPLEGWCVEVRTIDAAGNAGAGSSSCDACGVYDGTPRIGGDIPFEPVPGGPCDLAGSTSDDSSTGESPTTGADASSTSADDSGGASSDPDGSSSSDGTTGGAPGADGVTDRGCACGAGGGVDALAGLAVFGLVLGRRRRRRRAAHSTDGSSRVARTSSASM
ncbi:MAG: hypothetical protein IAG13_08330 [Deltaproteobacteria bacterium]|nr:hypothetical protein [Nannocystaceae bacterium]